MDFQAFSALNYRTSVVEKILNENGKVYTFDSEGCYYIAIEPNVFFLLGPNNTASIAVQWENNPEESVLVNFATAASNPLPKPIYERRAEPYMPFTGKFTLTISGLVTGQYYRLCLLRVFPNMEKNEVFVRGVQ